MQAGELVWEAPLFCIREVRCLERRGSMVLLIEGEGIGRSASHLIPWIFSGIWLFNVFCVYLTLSDGVLFYFTDKQLLL